MKDVWITGIGLVTALGGDRETTWRRLMAGECGIGPLTLFDPTGFRTRIAAQVDDESLTLVDPPRHASRASRFELVAATEALTDARLSTAFEPRPWALVMGGGAAGLPDTEVFIARRLRKGPRARGLTEFLELMQDVPTDHVARRFGLTGTRITISTACSSSTIAIGMAAELITDGVTPVALAGGTDAISRLVYAGFNSLRAADPNPCRPFDRNRQGLSFGEGSAVLVLEDADHARARGARPYACILGYGATNDAFHMTQPDPSGVAWTRTLDAALSDAGLAAGDVDYINAHGTATEQNDAAECAAYVRFFGDRLSSIPVSSVKGALGHCLCNAGGVEAALTALAVSRQMVPPTVGFREADPACPVDPVPGQGRPLQIRHAISSSFAFGGNSGVLVLGSCP
ncbi:MAG TPA: beta-ketoacyl-[acyl-carrier-protein] synthase family protein [Thermoanaerobaculaceae bacterium]|nr:beta-ketoacyl-[acyl-carrier-protein] synthase family protein [Thermoanaerobaculaceae bacterium]HPS79994.1 beta-ketoacyl-[acyl-carrier-protein] synthase family protein [Thermoanaerobaculaceae bacterium]